MGGKGGKRKGGGLAVPSFGAGGLRTPCPTPSASESVACAAEVELASGMSYDVPVKVPRMSVAESVADVAALSDGVRHLVVSPVLAGVNHLLVTIGNLRVVPAVRAHLLSEVEQMRGCLEAAESGAVELSRLRRVLVGKEGELWDAGMELRRTREERDVGRGELEAERGMAGVELGVVRGELELVRGELESVRKEVGVIVTERDEARKESAHRLMRMDRFQEGGKIVEKEMKRLLQEGFDLQAEI